MMNFHNHLTKRHTLLLPKFRLFTTATAAAPEPAVEQAKRHPVK